jgi:hypothetical protein
LAAGAILNPKPAPRKAGIGMAGPALTIERRHMAKRKRKQPAGSKQRRWSRRVTEASAALMLEPGVFTLSTPRLIALSLKRSADASQARKSAPFRSAMSMLAFYINRAGKGLSAARKKKLERAKDELRVLYGRPKKTD